MNETDKQISLATACEWWRNRCASDGLSPYAVELFKREMLALDQIDERYRPSDQPCCFTCCHYQLQDLEYVCPKHSNRRVEMFWHCGAWESLLSARQNERRADK